MNDRHETNRWRGVIAVALVAAALGLLAENPPLFLLGGVGVAVAAYPLVTPEPAPRLELERRLGETSPSHGDEVEVTVTLRNTGSWPLFDVRFFDGVPDALSVTDGRARRGVVLLPDSEATFSYTVAARRGTHAFEPATVVVRDLSGATEVKLHVNTETEIDCMADEGDVPLRPQTLESVGRILADDGGAGVEFYRTREHQPGDPLNRIDWNHLARTGEATTVDFRREQAATVVVLVDASEAAYRGTGDDPHAVTLGVSAAEQLIVALLEGHNKVGLAGIGRGPCWVAPASGRDHRVRVRETLATHETFRSTPPTESAAVEDQIEAIRSRLGNAIQVIVVSPLTGDDIAGAIRTFDAHGHAATVINPVVTGEETLGERLAEVERRNRVNALRSAGIPTVEWEPDRPLLAALASARRTGP
jgi:uncharacterized protein (DUF58 family)